LGYFRVLVLSCFRGKAFIRFSLSGMTLATEIFDLTPDKYFVPAALSII
jgi:hypothetical protein